MSERFDLIVVGAGPAGTTAALRAAELGARVALIDRHRRTGGTCTNTGCVPTRVLAKTARLLRDIRGAEAYGIRVSPPEIEWTATLSRLREVIAEVHASKRDEERLRAAGCALFLGETAAFRSPFELLLAPSQRSLAADRIILCVGGRARRLPFPGVEHVIFPSDLLSLAALPRSVVIVGSGYTGVQLVTVMNAFGCEVTLLEMAPQVLPGADHDVGLVLAESFRQHGVSVETAISGIDRVELEEDGRRRLFYSRGERQMALVCDTVLLCTGWPAATEGLGLEQAGVEMRGGYLTVNDYLQTNVPHIYVAGDANGRGMLVQAAHAEARAAAENAVRGVHRKAAHALLPSGGFTDPDHAGVGLTEAAARREHPDCLVVKVPFGELERAIIDNREAGFFKLIVERKSGVVLGAHCAGESGVEVIQAVATAMAAGVRVGGLAEVELAYPTYTAVIGMAARRLIDAGGSWLESSTPGSF